MQTDELEEVVREVLPIIINVCNLCDVLASTKETLFRKIKPLADTKLHVTKALLFMKLAATKLHVTKALLFMKLAATKLHVTKALLFMKLAATKLHVTKALLFMKLAATKLHVTKALLFMKLAVTKLHVTKALLFMKLKVTCDQSKALLFGHTGFCKLVVSTYVANYKCRAL